MDFFNKAKEAAEKYTGGGDSSKKDDKKKDSDSIFTKAMDAVEKYHVKDKAVEFAQKQVAKREEEKLKPGYVEKKDKSVVDKAKEAAEDFLAKQGNKQEEAPVSKPVEKPKESRPRSSSSSSSSSSDSEKSPRPKSPQTTPVIVQQTTPVAPPTYPQSTVNTGNYPAKSGEADCSDSFNRMNLDEPSSTGKYESYQEYWGNGTVETALNDSQTAITNRTTMLRHRTRLGWKLVVLTTAKRCRAIRVERIIRAIKAEVTEAISSVLVITTVERLLQKNTMVDRTGRGIMKVDTTLPARMRNVFIIRKSTTADRVVRGATRSEATPEARSQGAIKAPRRTMVDREVTLEVIREMHLPVDMGR